MSVRKRTSFLNTQRLSLEHPTGTTTVVAGDGALQDSPNSLGDWLSDRTVFVITSPNVWSLHGSVLEPTLAGAARWIRLEVAEGEAAKNLAHAERLWDSMLAEGGRRDSRVVAFGGGTVGDLAGFVAGCYLRGIEFAQVPTTLLAQVDASLGGKTAVNLPLAKNSIGLFHHPTLVIADTRFIQTLPEPELRSGLVEVVKAGLALDRSLFETVEDNLDALLSADGPELVPVVVAAMRAKISVVESDPSEGGRRRLLNLGHTLGHALEANLGFHGLRHGEAVGYGISFALDLARTRGLGGQDVERVKKLLRRLSLPPLPPLDTDLVLEAMRRDKKSRQDAQIWVLPVEVGEAKLFSDISEAELGEELHRFLADPSV